MIFFFSCSLFFFFFSPPLIYTHIHTIFPIKTQPNTPPKYTLLYRYYRVRSASVEVIHLLIKAGASPSARNSSSSSSSSSSRTPLSPLTLILLRGSKLSSSTSSSSSSSSEGDTTTSTILQAPLGSEEEERCRMSSRGIWLRAAETLINNGAVWDNKWRAANNGDSQLHLLLAGFPPPAQLASTYRLLLSSALDAGCSPNSVDMKGTSALVLLCKKMANVSIDVCPDASRIMRVMLDAGSSSSSTTSSSSISADTLRAIDTILASSSSSSSASIGASSSSSVSSSSAAMVSVSSKSCLAAVRPMLSTSSSGSSSLSVTRKGK